MNDPFAHLDLDQIRAAERKYRANHPILWRVAEFVVFVRGPWKWVRGAYRRRRLGYRNR
jgi:hypothetical protein